MLPAPLVFAAKLGGSIVGSLRDPMIWVVMFLMLLIGQQRLAVKWAFILAIFIALVRIAIAIGNRNRLGLPITDTIYFTGLAGFFITVACYCMGRAFERLRVKLRSKSNVED